jgi:hypothetical protein
MKSYIASALENLGNVCALKGDLARAAVRLRESLRLGRELRDQHVILYSLGDLAKLEAMRGRPERAARLDGLVVRLRGLLGIHMPPAEDEGRARALDRARQELGEARFRRAWEGGQALNLDEAVTEALDEAGQ